MAVIADDAQISTMNKVFCQEHGFKIYPLDKLLHMMQTEGFLIPDLGYMEVNLKIPQISKFNKDIVMLVIPDSKYEE